MYINKIPLSGVKIREMNTENYTFSDKKGYFFLERRNLNSVNNLIFEVDKVKDTIELLRGNGLKKTYYYFLNNNTDTIDLYRERIFKNQAKGN